jgi:putative thioredoxin
MCLEIVGTMTETSGPSNPSPHVINVTSESFAREVIERSSQVLVVVDFWATWCAPCRLLGPVLERLAGEYGGKFVLAKLDIDQSPDVAGEFGVRSIPAVLGLREGAVYDGFVGVRAESAIRVWINKLMPTEGETLAIEARALETTNPREAEAKYAEALELEAELPKAQIGLARLALAAGHLEDAAARIAALERRGFLEPEAGKLKAELSLRVQAQGTGSVEAARNALLNRPNDLSLKFALAEALAAREQYADALALCLELVERDRKGIGERARQTMVTIFQLLPPDHDLVIDYQRQLSLVL